ncbi:TPA: ABC transporter ATP-binding protein [Acinetobacter baumannii]|nr:ABC transporter ATP-binding protein [Acinetobacter baumannii]
MNNKTPLSTQSLIEVKNLSFNRGERVIYDNISLNIRRGQITAIMGPSGTGKTTLLRLIGGQLVPDQGEVLLDGKDIAQMSRQELFAARARMGMLFQSGALFTDMSVYENVAFPIRAHTKLSENLIAELVALARAIALDPDLIMYDEPFAGQDPIVKGVLTRLIRSLREALDLTTIIVSHDVPETLSIADYIYVVAEGKIQGEGTPEELQAYASPFVKQFLTGSAEGPVEYQFSHQAYLDNEVRP